jgi:hypothetical protein
MVVAADVLSFALASRRVHSVRGHRYVVNLIVLHP